MGALFTTVDMTDPEAIVAIERWQNKDVSNAKLAIQKSRMLEAMWKRTTYVETDLNATELDTENEFLEPKRCQVKTSREDCLTIGVSFHSLNKILTGNEVHNQLSLIE